MLVDCCYLFVGGLWLFVCLLVIGWFIVQFRKIAWCIWWLSLYLGGFCGASGGFWVWWLCFVVAILARWGCWLAV